MSARDILREIFRLIAVILIVSGMVTGQWNVVAGGAAFWAMLGVWRIEDRLDGRRK